MELYPNLHPLRRQAQADFENNVELEEKQILFENSVRVTAEKGEVVFIPAFWMSEFSANEDSVFLTFHTSSFEEYLFSQAYWTKLSLDHKWNAKQRTVFAHFAVIQIVSLVLQQRPEVCNTCNREAPLFVHQQVFKKRYEPLSISSQSSSAAQFEVHKCHKEAVSLRGDHLKVLSDFGVPLDKKDAKESLRKVADFFLKIEDENILSLLLADYVEKLVLWAVKSPSEVVSFLHYCF